MEPTKIEERANVILEKVNFWIGNVDAKVSFVISFTGVFLGFIFASDSITATVQKCFKALEHPLLNNYITVVFSFIKILFFVLSIFYIGLSIYNQLKALQAKVAPDRNTQTELEENSSIFWGTIVKSDFQAYKQNLNLSSDDKFINDLQSQIFINSLICKEKFSNYNYGLKNLKVGIINFIIFKIFTYLPF